MPRISECGHVFCLSCIIRQMQVARKCAICGAGPLMLEDLRPVRLELFGAPQPGQSWDFQLVRRSGENVGLPGQRPTSSLPQEGDPGWQFARRVRGDPEARMDFLHQELRAVEAGDAEACLKSAKELLQKQLTEACAASSVHAAAGANGSRRTGDDNGQTATVVFYQSTDGQLIFLEPALTKQLLATHGSWGNLPMHICLQPVQAMRDVSVTSDLQWRHRFLDHLATGSDVVFADGLLQIPGETEHGRAPLESTSKTLPSGSPGKAKGAGRRSRNSGGKGKGKGKGSSKHQEQYSKPAKLVVELDAAPAAASELARDAWSDDD